MRKLLLSLLLCLAISSLKAATYFVTPTGAGDHSGTDWDNAMTLAQAITAATNGDNIFVLKGTYTATSGQPLINLTSANNGIKLYGGFITSQTTLVARTSIAASDSTYFVGNGSRVIYNQGTSGSPISNVVYDGFFIKDGNIAAVGGGMSNTYASVTVANCIFKGNKATNGTGGAIYNNYNTVNISNCKFYANSSNSNGGGVIISTSSNATITDCIFDSNSGGGYGGGLAVYTDYDKPTNVAVSNCTFTRNKTSATGGAGIGVDRAAPTIVKCTILGNEVTGSGNSGGGLFNRDTDAKYINCLIAGNKAPNAGGGAYNINSAAYNCTPVFINCTIAGNNAPSNGGAMWNTGSNANGKKTNAVITNCIIYGNNHGIGNSAGAAATAAVTYSNVQYTGTNSNETNYSSGIGNLNADPLFTNSPAFSTAPFITGDYTLQSNSANAVDKGLNSAIAISGFPTDLSNNPIDILGNPRIYNGGTVDMGAYEYQGVLPVTISTFTASLVNNRTQLKWSVGTENKVNRYEIERSQNGIDFTKVTEVSANGSASYNATDNHPPVGVNYYRLVSIDNDGTIAVYAAIQTVKVTSLAGESVQVYPNPVKGNVINLTLNGYAAGNYTYKLVNAAGATVQQGNVSYGSSNVTIATTASAGVYVLYLSNGNSVVKTKLVKL